MTMSAISGAGDDPEAADDTIRPVGPGSEKRNAASAAAAAEPPEVHYRGWQTMPFVIGNETFEKLGSIGTAANLMVYLTSVFHMSNVHAAMALNAFSGTTNLATVLGAFVSDAFLGRYVTVGLGCIATLTGMIILTLTAAIPALHPPPCARGGSAQCVEATRGQFAVLVLSFAFIVAGAGGIRPCNLAFGADQFDPRTDAGRRGVNSFFNWYYFTFTIAVCVSSTAIIYVQSDVSWWIGFLIPAGFMLLSCVLFFAGGRFYVKVRPDGSPFASIARVAVAAFRKRRAPAPEEPRKALFKTHHASSLVTRLPYTDQFKFLDKAAVVVLQSEVTLDGLPKNPWRLCSLQQVEEAKCILRIIPVWATGIVYYIAFAQTNTYAVLQALQSDRHLPGARAGSAAARFEVPAASFTVFPMLALTLWIPIYDRLVLPWARRLTGREEGITLLQRMGIGITLAAEAMVVAGAVEARRRRSSPEMSALWLVPQLALLGLSEAFNHVSQLEFYYKQFPENMRSVAGSLLFIGLALSNYLSGLLVSVVHRSTGGGGRSSWLAEDLNDGRLDYFYFLIAGVGVLNFFFFLACARWYRYKVAADDQDIPS